jgi:hypothetical protein
MNHDALNAWAKPLLNALREMEEAARSVPGDASMLNDLAKRVAALPLPDWEPLADEMTAGMTQAAAGEIGQWEGRFSRSRQRRAAFAVDRDFAPIEEAARKISARTPVGSKLRSEEWLRVPLALRERAQFSSGVESIRVMANIQSKLEARVGHYRELLANNKEAFVSRESFIRDIRQIARDEGLDTGKGNVLTNIAAPRRIGLIYDMQNAQAAGYARWKLDNDRDALAILPAWRLGGSTARNPRSQGEWLARWREAGAAVNWQGAHRSQMVALKTSRIWMRLSRFGTPWPPFDFGSTRELEDVWRDEAEQLGLVSPDDDIAPTMEKDFNEELEASAAGWRPDQVSTLELAFGDQVEFFKGRVAWRSPGQPYKNYADIGLAPADSWRDLPTEPERMKSADAIVLMKSGVSVRGRGGQMVRFDQDTLDHWRGYRDEQIRPSFLRVAMETVENPREVWKQETQSVYLQAFEKPIGGKYKGCVVAVRNDGGVRTYFVESLKRLDNARKGIGLWGAGS